MAYTKASLKSKIIAKLIAGYGVTPTDANELDKFADAIAAACVEEMGNAVVTVTGVQSGASAATGTVS